MLLSFDRISLYVHEDAADGCYAGVIPIAKARKATIFSDGVVDLMLRLLNWRSSSGNST